MLRSQVDALKHYLISDNLERSEAFSAIITVSRKMRSLFQYMEAIASSGEPVMITGETGVGKELLAQAVHTLSGRTGQFVPINIAGLDDTLLSDTLFGHRRGAFSGADTAREGLVAQAGGGTLFLDEIGDLTLASQVKLLRLLQDQQYYPLGSDMAKVSDIRVICATNQELNSKLKEETFRSDLYFRLSVHQVMVPPLRERSEDLNILLSHFIHEAAATLGKTPPSASPELITLLENYDFPGNVRELRSMVYDAVARHSTGSILAAKSFRKAIKNQRKSLGMEQVSQNSIVSSKMHFPTLKEAEQMHIAEALRRANENQGIAATLLGISRPALNRRLARSKKQEGN